MDIKVNTDPARTLSTEFHSTPCLCELSYLKACDDKRPSSSGQITNKFEDNRFLRGSLFRR